MRFLNGGRRTQYYESKEKFQNFTTNVGTNIENTMDTFKGEDGKKDIIKELMSTDYPLDAKKIAALQDYKQTLLDASAYIIADHTKALEQAMLAQPTDSAKAIYAMVAKIRYATHLIKDMDNPQSLVNNLGTACE